MKIIDLLNKIANGEEVPYAIKWGCHDFRWFVYEYKAKGELGEPTLLDYLAQCPQMLNDKIITFDKIEEEKKIPEKIDHLIGYDIQQFDDLKEYVEITTNDLFGKINKVIDTLDNLIDYLKSKGE